MLLPAKETKYNLYLSCTEAEDPKALEESYASLYPLHKMGKVADMANAVKIPVQRGKRIYYRRNHERVRRKPDLTEDFHYGYFSF